MVSFTVAQAGIEQEDIVFGAEATLVKYESAIKIPIPFMDKSYKLGISIAWNTRGSFEAGKNGFKFHAPFGPDGGLWGFGLEVNVKE